MKMSEKTDADASVVNNFMQKNSYYALKLFVVIFGAKRLF